eukprot:g7354.t1
MRTLLFTLCLLSIVTLRVKADDECRCLKVSIGRWEITFETDESLPFSKTGTMEIQHDFDELYHGKVRLTRFGLPLNLEIMGFLNATACVFRGSMANVLKSITIPFKWTIDETGGNMSGMYILRHNGKVSKEFGNNSVKFKQTASSMDLTQNSNEAGSVSACDEEEEASLTKFAVT